MSINSQQVMSSINLGQLEARLKPVFQFLAKIPLDVWQRVVRVLLVVWLAYVLAQMIWMLVPKPTIPPAKVDMSVSSPQASMAQSNSIDIDKLKTATPFGDAAAAPAVDAQPEVNIDTQQVTDTQLNLILRGLVYSNDEKVARAVIATNDKQEVFAVGDPIPVGNNVTLAKILADRVIINNNGRNESLWLFKDDPNAPKMTSFSAPPNPSIDNQPMGARPPIAYTPPQSTAPAGNDIAQMGNTLSDVVAMSIHRENGQIVGYKIRPGRNAEMFNSLGLQPDDIVTAVNGMPLNNPGKIMEIYRSMGSATSANLQILRNGGTVNLDISLNR
jgi:general secretion pathway protein C